MHSYLIDMLECLCCHGELSWQVGERHGDRIEEAAVSCKACRASYAVHEGIGVFLTPDLQRKDLWEAGSGLEQYVREHADVERRLMAAPVDALNPADQFLRALVLEDRGDFGQADGVARLAMSGLYTQEYLSCWDSQILWVVDRLREAQGPIVDLASGRCYLVERLAGKLPQAIVATDFSPRVLRRDAKRLEYLGVSDRVSLLAFDGRRTPFKSRAVGMLTTNLGLPNIAEPRGLLSELRRIVAGTFIAISQFHPEGDEVKTKATREAEPSSPLMRRRATIEALSAANWHVVVENLCTGRALPTPRGEVIDGAVIDRYPTAQTDLEWCTLVAQ